jgi:LmbE family N-acetylglucosaminyl deacetylase
VYVICTDGSRGSNDAHMAPSRMKPIRHAEQTKAAHILGVQTVVLLDYEDGTLEPTLELRRDLTRLIRRFKPEIVISADPTLRFRHNNHINHPDHRAAGEAALYAVFPSAETRFVFPELLEEGLEPHRVLKLFLFASADPDTWVDITETVDLKVAALKAHQSQVREDLAEAWIRARSGAIGKRYGVTCAEEFKVLTLVREG